MYYEQKKKNRINFGLTYFCSRIRHTQLFLIFPLQFQTYIKLLDVCDTYLYELVFNFRYICKQVLFSKMILAKFATGQIFIHTNLHLNIDINVSIVQQNFPCKICMRIGFYSYEFVFKYRCKCKYCLAKSSLQNSTKKC